jgi:hypothetical protein
LSYRRDDARHVADRIYQRLAAEFGSHSVFKDVDSVPLGSDFRRVIEDAVMQCGVLLAVIGERWLSVADAQGQRRLDDPNDFVRLEIEHALSRDIPVIPVIVDKASVPRPEELPSSLEPIAYRQSAVVRPDPDFERDMDRLTSSLGQILHSRMRMQDTGSAKTTRKPQKLRYYCYISRSKVDQLFDQLPLADEEGAIQDQLTEETSESKGPFAPYTRDLRFGGRGRSDFSDTDSSVRKLAVLLRHIERHEKVLDLVKLCKEKARVSLDAFCYTYCGRFYNLGDISRGSDSGIHISGAALRRSRDDIVLSKSLLIEPARVENSVQEVGPGNNRIVSNMCILCSEIEDSTLRLACSYKFFSDMGGQLDERRREWEVHPHSGNYHFFEGEVDAWFETVIFINGIRGSTILGTPLFLVHSSDPELVL